MNSPETLEQTCCSLPARVSGLLQSESWVYSKQPTTAENKATYQLRGYQLHSATASLHPGGLRPGGLRPGGLRHFGRDQPLKTPQQSIRANEILGRVAKEPRAQGALGVLKASLQQSLRSNAVGVNSVVDACLKGVGHSTWSKALWMASNAGAPRGSVNLMAFGAAISSCPWQQAFGLLQTMEVMLLQPNYIILSAAIGCCASAAAWLAAVELLKEIRASAWPVALRLVEEGGDVQAINSAITACKQAQWLD
eukprot:s2662_g8.t1